jgi:hypothetical protein
LKFKVLFVAILHRHAVRSSHLSASAVRRPPSAVRRPPSAVRIRIRIRIPHHPPPHLRSLNPMTMTPCQQRRSSSAPMHSTSSIFTTIFILTLYVFAGTATVVAYAKPPSPSSSPWSPRPTTTRCQHKHKICTSTTGDAKDPCLRTNSRLALLNVGYGGTANRRLTSLFSTKSEGGVTTIDNGGQVKNNAKYHLVWSQNFLKKMVLSMAGWWLLQYTVIMISSRISVDGMPCHVPTSERWQGVVLPLLSSSCCAIQLVINAISGWGCAGFNTYLGKAVRCDVSNPCQ